MRLRLHEGGGGPVLEATEVPVPHATQSEALKARLAENHLNSRISTSRCLLRIRRLQGALLS